MKRSLMAGAACIAIIGFHPGVARADVKNYENMSSGATYISDESPAQAQQAAPIQPREESRVQTIEPQAGSETSAYRDDTRSDFTGPYVGADFGYNWSDFDVRNPAGPDGGVDAEGWEGGLLAGFGYAVNAFGIGGYMGLEAGYEWSGSDGSLGGVAYEKNNNWLITLRPGVTVGVIDGNALAYGVVGYSRAEFEANGDEDNLDGLVLGGGMEFGVWNAPVKMRLEYNYINYEDTSLSNIDFEAEENTVKTGLVFRL